MAMCPFRAGEYMLTKPGSTGKPGSNGKVKRIIMHITGAPLSIKRQAPINKRVWEQGSSGGFGVSAHFTIEGDGAVFQHVDTNTIAKGTGWLTGQSIHIEHCGKPKPTGADEMTRQQFHASALLLAWLSLEHPDIPLVATGTSYSDYGDPEKPGVTCHRFIQEKWSKDPSVKKRVPYWRALGASDWRNCPGPDIVARLPTIIMMANTYAPLIEMGGPFFWQNLQVAMGMSTE
ncbi:MAG: N-acetylmuramoyl-L-alanine amidase [Alphaproteobacteria bacterium]|nr:N-acetylmuramoyl-L-alanine amidase [Alphaproteobacteria bacterium]